MPFFPNAKAAVDDSIDKAKQRLEGPQQPVDDLTSSLNGLSLDAQSDHDDDDDDDDDNNGEDDDGEGDHEGEDSDDDTTPPASNTTTDTKEIKKRQPPTTPPPNNTPVLTASSSINTDDTDTLVRDLQALVVDMESSSYKPQQVQRPLDELIASPDTSKPRQQQQPSLAELMAAAQFGIE
jgi:hypothetical protein